MASLISKKHVRLVKIFLVSPQLENVLLFSYVIIFIAFILLRTIILTSPEVIFREKAISDSLAKELSAVTSQSEFIDWLSNDIPSKFITPAFSTFKLFGNMRLFQIQIDVPDSCYTKDLSQLELYQASFTKACNPLIQDAVVATKITPTDTSKCNEPDCAEFRAISDETFDVSSDYFTYPDHAFSVDFGRGSATTFQTKLSNIKNNGWLSDYKTKVLVFQMNLIEPSTKTIVSIRAQMESFSIGIYECKLLKDVLTIYTAPNIVYLVLTICFLINGILSLFKNVFELSIHENKFIYLADICTAGFQIVLSICFLTNNASFDSFLDKRKDLPGLAIESRFFEVTKLITLYNVENIIFYLMSLILPIKVFSLITLSKHLQQFQKIISAIFRTLPSVLIYMIIAGPLIIVWAFIFYNILGDYSPRFATFTEAILNFTFYDISHEVMDSDYQSDASQSITLNLSLFYMMIVALRYMIMGFYIAIICEAYNRSASLEYHQYTTYEREDRDFVAKMIRKIERFSKDSLPQSDNSGKNNVDRKMLVWLSFTNDDNSLMMDTIYNKIEDQNIHLIQFFSLNEIIQFLKYLFKLKPNLLHKSANQFRIVIDNSRSEDYRGNNFAANDQAFDIERVDSLLAWLKYVGSRVPLMIFSSTKLKYETMLKMRLKYHLMYFSNTMNNLVKFSIMDSLDNIVESHQKEDTISMSESFGLEELDTFAIDE